MTTARVIIDRSARMLGVKAQGQPLSAEDDAAFLIGLNSMLTRWEADGLSMGFSSVSAATSTLPVPVELEEAIAANLAVRMAAEFQILPSQAVVSMALDGYNAVKRDTMTVRPVTPDVPMAQGKYDINSDSFN